MNVKEEENVRGLALPSDARRSLPWRDTEGPPQHRDGRTFDNYRFDSARSGIHEHPSELPSCNTSTIRENVARLMRTASFRARECERLSRDTPAWHSQRWRQCVYCKQLLIENATPDKLLNEELNRFVKGSPITSIEPGVCDKCFTFWSYAEVEFYLPSRNSG